MSPDAMAVLAAVALVGVHLLSRRFRWLDLEPRHRLLSIAGGVPVGYVFIQLLPNLARGQEKIENLGGVQLPTVLASISQQISNQVYLVALTSFLAFYGLERLVAGGRKTVEGATDAAGEPSAALCWLHVGSFALTNALTGYLLVQRASLGIWPLLLFTVAMGLWFLVNDRGLDARHPARFDRIGRWCLCGALLLGWGAGALSGTVIGVAATMLQAIICGSVLLNVLAVEMPSAHRARFWPFALGAVGYSVLLLAA